MKTFVEGIKSNPVQSSQLEHGSDSSEESNIFHDIMKDIVTFDTEATEEAAGPSAKPSNSTKPLSSGHDLHRRRSSKVTRFSLKSSDTAHDDDADFNKAKRLSLSTETPSADSAAAERGSTFDSKETSRDDMRGRLSSSDINEGSSDKQTLHHLEALVEQWKSKYKALEAAHATLTREYNQLLKTKPAAASDEASLKNEAEALKKKVAELQKLCDAKDKVIERLEAKEPGQLQASRSPNAASTSDLTHQLKEASQRIIEQNEEIQKLLEQRFDLEEELRGYRQDFSTLNLDHSPKMLSNDLSVSEAQASETERVISHLKSANRDKDNKISHLMDELAELQLELERVSAAADLVAETKTKKKKSWWGGSSKSKTKADKEKQPAADSSKRGPLTPAASGLISPRASPSPRSPKLSPNGQSGLAQSPISEIEPSSTGKGDAAKLGMRPHRDAMSVSGSIINKHLGSLKWENEQLEDELEHLQRERGFFEAELKKAKAEVDVLQAALANQENNFKNLSLSKYVATPIPEDMAGSEDAPLKSVVQIQSAAIRQLSLKNAQLELRLKRYVTEIEMSGKSEQENLGPAVDPADEEASAIRSRTDDLASQLATTKLLLAASRKETAAIKLTMDSLLADGSSRLQALTDKTNRFAVLIGKLIREKGDLSQALQDAHHSHLKSIQDFQGEIRALRSGRVERLKGTSPFQDVFPSPLPVPADSRSGQYEARETKTPEKNLPRVTMKDESIAACSLESSLPKLSSLAQDGGLQKTQSRNTFEQLGSTPPLDSQNQISPQASYMRADSLSQTINRSGAMKKPENAQPVMSSSPTYVWQQPTGEQGVGRLDSRTHGVSGKSAQLQGSNPSLAGSELRNYYSGLSGFPPPDVVVTEKDQELSRQALRDWVARKNQNSTAVRGAKSPIVHHKSSKTPPSGLRSDSSLKNANIVDRSVPTSSLPKISSSPVRPEPVPLHEPPAFQGKSLNIPKSSLPGVKENEAKKPSQSLYGLKPKIQIPASPDLPPHASRPSPGSYFRADNAKQPFIRDVPPPSPGRRSNPSPPAELTQEEIADLMRYVGPQAERSPHQSSASLSNRTKDTSVQALTSLVQHDLSLLAPLDFTKINLTRSHLGKSSQVVML